MSCLVIVEHNNANLKSATLNTVSAAIKIGGDIDLLVVGAGCAGAADAAAKVTDVSKVFVADSEEYAHQLPEDVAPLVVRIADAYSHILAPADTFGKNLMPRIAALMDVQQISDISAVVSDDTFERPVYAGNAVATVRSSDNLKVITVRTTAFDAVGGDNATAAGIEALPAAGGSGLSEFLGTESSVTERPELAAAKVVVSGGRALASQENFELLERIADLLGGAVGASRAAVDAGYVPNEFQVGQTGKIVAPQLYIAVGISGAIQHLAGMKDSKVIVAINKDEEAPIFQIADYGLVGDLFEIVPELERELQKLLAR